MYTMGREREKALVAKNPLYQGDLSPHYGIIDAYHDWHDGTFGATECLDRVFQLLGEVPKKWPLETAGYWFRRATGD